MECKVRKLGYIVARVEIWILPEWNVKLVNPKQLKAVLIDWNITRMECKVALYRYRHYKLSDWNITRMECKGVIGYYIDVSNKDWNITRMECKVRNIGISLALSVVLKYNQKGM